MTMSFTPAMRLLGVELLERCWGSSLTCSVLRLIFFVPDFPEVLVLLHLRLLPRLGDLGLLALPSPMKFRTFPGREMSLMLALQSLRCLYPCVACFLYFHLHSFGTWPCRTYLCTSVLLSITCSYFSFVYYFVFLLARP